MTDPCDYSVKSKSPAVLRQQEVRRPGALALEGAWLHPVPPCPTSPDFELVVPEVQAQAPQSGG